MQEMKSELEMRRNSGGSDCACSDESIAAYEMTVSIQNHNAEIFRELSSASSLWMFRFKVIAEFDLTETLY